MVWRSLSRQKILSRLALGVFLTAGSALAFEDHELPSASEMPSAVPAPGLVAPPAAGAVSEPEPEQAVGPSSLSATKVSAPTQSDESVLAGFGVEYDPELGILRWASVAKVMEGRQKNARFKELMDKLVPQFRTELGPDFAYRSSLLNRLRETKGWQTLNLPGDTAHADPDTFARHRFGPILAAAPPKGGGVSPFSADIYRGSDWDLEALDSALAHQMADPKRATEAQVKKFIDSVYPKTFPKEPETILLSELAHTENLPEIGKILASLYKNDEATALRRKAVLKELRSYHHRHYLASLGFEQGLGQTKQEAWLANLYEMISRADRIFEFLGPRPPEGKTPEERRQELSWLSKKARITDLLGVQGLGMNAKVSKIQKALGKAFVKTYQSSSEAAREEYWQKAIAFTKDRGEVPPGLPVELLPDFEILASAAAFGASFPHDETASQQALKEGSPPPPAAAVRLATAEALAWERLARPGVLDADGSPVQKAMRADAVRRAAELKKNATLLQDIYVAHDLKSVGPDGNSHDLWRRERLIDWALGELTTLVPEYVNHMEAESNRSDRFAGLFRDRDLKANLQTEAEVRLDGTYKRLLSALKTLQEEGFPPEALTKLRNKIFELVEVHRKITDDQITLLVAEAIGTTAGAVVGVGHLALASAALSEVGAQGMRMIATHGLLKAGQMALPKLLGAAVDGAVSGGLLMGSVAVTKNAFILATKSGTDAENLALFSRAIDDTAGQAATGIAGGLLAPVPQAGPLMTFFGTKAGVTAATKHAIDGEYAEALGEGLTTAAFTAMIFGHGGGKAEPTKQLAMPEKMKSLWNAVKRMARRTPEEPRSASHSVEAAKIEPTKLEPVKAEPIKVETVVSKFALTKPVKALVEGSSANPMESGVLDVGTPMERNIARLERVEKWSNWLRWMEKGGWKEAVTKLGMEPKQNIPEQLVEMGRVAEQMRFQEHGLWAKVKNARERLAKARNIGRGKKEFAAATKEFSEVSQAWDVVATKLEAHQKVFGRMRLAAETAPNLENGRLEVLDVINWKTVKVRNATRSEFEEFTEGDPIFVARVRQPGEGSSERPLDFARTFTTSNQDGKVLSFDPKVGMEGYSGLTPLTAAEHAASDTMKLAAATPHKRITPKDPVFTNEHNGAGRYYPQDESIVLIGTIAAVKADPATGVFSDGPNKVYMNNKVTGLGHGGRTQVAFAVRPGSKYGGPFEQLVGVTENGLPEIALSSPKAGSWAENGARVRDTNLLPSVRVRVPKTKELLFTRQEARYVMEQVDRGELASLYQQMEVLNHYQRRPLSSDPALRDWQSWPKDSELITFNERLSAAAADAEAHFNKLEQKLEASGLSEAKKQSVRTVLAHDRSLLQAMISDIRPPN